MRRRAGVERSISFSMTPMVDVVMLLIIFFMLVSKFSGEEAELLSLPFARGAEPAFQQEVKPQFVVNVKPALVNDRKAAVYIYQGMQIDPEVKSELDDLTNRLRQFKTLYPNGQVIIRADKRVQSKYIQWFQALCLTPGIDISQVQYATSAAE